MGNDRSIDEQLASGRDRAGHEGWHLIASYSDRVSASRLTTRQRDDWTRLLQDLARPDVSILWLWESSRGDRKLSTWAALLEDCREHAVQIYVETHRRLYDMNVARDWQTMAEEGVYSQVESEKIRERTQRAMDENAADGTPHGQALYGYAHSYDRRGRFAARVVVQAEARNVRDLFTRLRAGHALRAVARDWEASGIRTRAGKPFSAQHLRTMALNPAYAGLRVHLTRKERSESGGRLRLDTAVPGKWDAIVPRAEWQAVHDMLTSPERRTSRPGRAVHLLSVSSAARCDVCGGPLAAEHRPISGTRVWMYFCAKSGHVRISEADLDALATDVICGYLADERNYSALTPDTSPELQAVRDELAGLRASLADLADAVTKRGKSPAWAMAATDDYEAQISALEDRERALTAPSALAGLLAPGPDVAARWEAAPVSTRREVARIVLAPGRVGVMRISRGRGGPAVGRVTWAR
jgi:DNA invertase Pin-like site-specific DNA recombinase